MPNIALLLACVLRMVLGDVNYSIGNLPTNGTNISYEQHHIDDRPAMSESASRASGGNATENSSFYHAANNSTNAAGSAVNTTNSGDSNSTSDGDDNESVGEKNGTGAIEWTSINSDGNATQSINSIALVGRNRTANSAAWNGTSAVPATGSVLTITKGDTSRNESWSSVSAVDTAGHPRNTTGNDTTENRSWSSVSTVDTASHPQNTTGNASTEVRSWIATSGANTTGDLLNSTRDDQSENGTWSSASAIDSIIPAVNDTALDALNNPARHNISQNTSSNTAPEVAESSHAAVNITDNSNRSTHISPGKISPGNTPETPSPTFIPHTKPTSNQHVTCIPYCGRHQYCDHKLRACVCNRGLSGPQCTPEMTAEHAEKRHNINWWLKVAAAATSMLAIMLALVFAWCRSLRRSVRDPRSGKAYVPLRTMSNLMTSSGDGL